ncbi:LexA family transcriptional regulator [Pseudomaricurvus hydrocarbonicus]
MDIKRIRAQNLETLIAECDSVKACAAKIGIEPSYISQIRSGLKNIGHQIARRAEQAFNKPQGWMDQSHQAEYFQTEEGRPHYHTHANTAPSPQIKGYIPLISWVQAGSWAEAIDLYQPGDAESVHPTTINHGIHTFALRVDGDSMTAPTGAAGHSFPHGMIIYIDPDQEASPGDYVVARHNGHGHVTFKQYGTEEGRPVLKPLNTNGQYPIIRDEFQIIGKVIDASWGGL